VRPVSETFLSRTSVLITWQIRQRHVLLIILRWTQFRRADAINAKYVLTVKEEGFGKMWRGALFFTRLAESRKIFSPSYTRHTSYLRIRFGRSTRTSARIRSRRKCLCYFCYLHVRDCDFGNCSPRAMLNCEKRINLAMQESLKISTKSFLNDYDQTDISLISTCLVVLYIARVQWTRELTVQWRSCSDSICFNSIKLSTIIERKLNSHIAMRKKLHAESRDARIR